MILCYVVLYFQRSVITNPSTYSVNRSLHAQTLGQNNTHSHTHTIHHNCMQFVIFFFSFLSPLSD